MPSTEQRLWRRSIDWENRQRGRREATKSSSRVRSLVSDVVMTWQNMTMKGTNGESKMALLNVNDETQREETRRVIVNRTVSLTLCWGYKTIEILTNAYKSTADSRKPL